MNTTLTIDAIVREWKSQLQCKPAVRERYGNMIHRFLDTVDDQRWMSAEDVVRYISTMTDTGHAAYYVNDTISTIRNFFRYLDRMGYHTDVTSSIRNIKVQRWYHKEPLNEQQIVDLLATVSGTTLIQRRDRAILLLMLYCGLRCNEVAELNVGDIALEQGVTVLRLLRKGHKSKDMKIELIPEVYDAVEEYLTMRDISDEQPVISSCFRGYRGRPVRMSPSSISHIVKARLRQAGMDDGRYTAHSLRHTFGTMLLREGMPLATVSALMGHTNTSVTMVYVKQEEQRKLIMDRPIEKARNYIRYINNC